MNNDLPPTVPTPRATASATRKDAHRKQMMRSVLLYFLCLCSGYPLLYLFPIGLFLYFGMLICCSVGLAEKLTNSVGWRLFVTALLMLGGALISLAIAMAGCAFFNSH